MIDYFNSFIYSSYVICLPPIDLNRGVSNWQSINLPPIVSIALARWIRANFEALGTSENILSPKKALQSVTP